MPVEELPPVPDDDSMDEAMALLTEDSFAAEASIDLPDQKREPKAWKRFCRDPAAFAAAAAKKGAVK
eukprot:1598081-Lingulodinium_polyedra.AAC.1